MALMVGGQALCEKFKLDSRVGRHLVEACQLESLDDFAHFFVREEEVGQLVDSIEGIANKALAVSRLRQAWRAAATAGVIADDKKKRGADVVDEELSAPELSDLRELFHKRYEMRYPVSWSRATR